MFNQVKPSRWEMEVSQRTQKVCLSFSLCTQVCNIKSYLNCLQSASLPYRFLPCKASQLKKYSGERDIVAQYLPGKNEILSSIPGTHKKISKSTKFYTTPIPLKKVPFLSLIPSPLSIYISTSRERSYARKTKGMKANELKIKSKSLSVFLQIAY